MLFVLYRKIGLEIGDARVKQQALGASIECYFSSHVAVPTSEVGRTDCRDGLFST